MNICKIDFRSDELITQLLKVWEESVRATHLFLTEADICKIRGEVPAALKQIEHLIVATNEHHQPIAFIGIQDKSLEMLFIAPQERGKGLGRILMQQAIDELFVCKLCVNEQNPQAKGFYEHLGFEVIKRTECDDWGNPFPLLHMALPKDCQ